MPKRQDRPNATLIGMTFVVFAVQALYLPIHRALEHHGAHGHDVHSHDHSHDGTARGGRHHHHHDRRDHRHGASAPAAPTAVTATPSSPLEPESHRHPDIALRQTVKEHDLALAWEKTAPLQVAAAPARGRSLPVDRPLVPPSREAIRAEPRAPPHPPMDSYC